MTEILTKSQYCNNYIYFSAKKYLKKTKDLKRKMNPAAADEDDKIDEAMINHWINTKYYGHNSCSLTNWYETIHMVYTLAVTRMLEIIIFVHLL